MAIPQVVIARLGWMALGSLLTVASKSQFAKEATGMFKEGVNGLMEDYERDIEKNKAVVAKTKAGK